MANQSRFTLKNQRFEIPPPIQTKRVPSHQFTWNRSTFRDPGSFACHLPFKGTGPLSGSNGDWQDPQRKIHPVLPSAASIWASKPAWGKSLRGIRPKKKTKETQKYSPHMMRMSIYIYAYTWSLLQTRLRRNAWHARRKSKRNKDIPNTWCVCIYIYMLALLYNAVRLSLFFSEHVGTMTHRYPSPSARPIRGPSNLMM